MASSSILDELSGSWRTLGYNKLFQFSESAFWLYDVSAVSCLEAARGTQAGFLEVFDRFELHPDGLLSMYARGGVTRYLLERQPAEPVRKPTTRSDDPEYIFEVFWRYFQENYAFFELRGLDWQEIYRLYRPRIQAHTNPSDLLKMLTDILVALNDSHATLQVEGREISTRKPHTLVKQWQAEFHSGEFLSLYPRGIPRLCSFLQEDVLGGQGKTALDRQLLWGWLKEGVGYLAPFSLMDIFGGFDQLHFGGFEVANLDYLQQLDNALEQVVADLSGARVLVIDMRFNLGGHDAAAFKIAGHFTDQPRLALTKKAVHQQGFTPSQEIFIVPAAGRRYTGPLIVLTSPATASAAEVFLDCMLALPQATLVGEPSRGVLSDMLLMRLPNGWKTSLSNEVYTACDGNCYEGRGVKPRLEMPVFDESNFYKGLRAPVEQALEQIGQWR